MAREASTATGAAADAPEEDARIAPYAFVPAALRHDLWRDDGDDAGDGSASRAVADARRTRSALLVATLLYGEGNQQLHESTEVSRKIPAAAKGKAPGKVKKTGKKKKKATEESDAAAPTLPLYSLPVELALSKCVTFTNAVRQLDAYMDGIRARINALDTNQSRDVADVPAWMWDSTVKVPTVLQIQRKVVQTVAVCLPECDVYLAMYEPLPMTNPAAATPSPLLRYVAASPHSSMEGRVLLCEPSTPEGNEPAAEAPSFTVLRSLDPLLIQDVGDASSAATVRWLGRVDDRAVMTGPFACLPLVDSRESRAIGLLALDACRKAAQLRPEAMSPQALYEFLMREQLHEAAVEFRKLRFGGRQLLQLTANDLQHRPAYRLLKIRTKQRIMDIVAALRSGLPLHLPQGQRPVFFCDDDEALEFLDDVCERAGKFMDEYSRGVHWHRVMAKRTKEPKTTVLDVYAVLLQGIAMALTGVERICVWKIRDCADIDAIATSQLPDDRLLPFLEWSERQIRRVPLYCENEEDLGRLMQGNITRINLLPSLSQEKEHRASVQTCERAIYHVTWSNRTQQSMSWQQLRLILPIRPMNARHYQLSQLLKRLEKLRVNFEDAEARFDTSFHFHLSDPNALVAVLRDPHRPRDVLYALEIDFLPSPERVNDVGDREPDTAFAEGFIRRATSITQQNILCVRSREARSKRRLLSTAKTMQKFSSFGLTPSFDALRALEEIVAFIFEEISTNLPGSQQQVAELHPDGAQLRYTYAGHGSTLQGKALNRGQGVSFRCVDSRSPLLITPDSELRNRLKLLGASTVEPDGDLPYIFLPLLYEDTCLGVLSVNRFLDVPKGRTDEDHPEDGVVEYLVSLAKTLAAAIYLKRRAFALYNLHQLRVEPLRSPEQLFLGASRILQDVVIGVWKIRILEIDFVRGKSTTVYEYSDAARVQDEGVLMRQAIPIGYRAKELLPDTIAGHWAITLAEVDTLVQLWHKHESDSELELQALMGKNKVLNEMEKRKIWEWRVRRRYERLELEPLEDDFICPGGEGNPANSSTQTRKAIAVRAPNLKYIAQALGASMGSKTFAYANIDALKIGNSSGLYLAVATQPQFFAACEQGFVDRVVETLSRMMESLVQRVLRSRNRVNGLHDLALKCSAFVGKVHASLDTKPVKVGSFPLSPSEEVRTEGLLDLVDSTVGFVSSILECPNVYVALHEPFHRRLRYVAASPKSSMKGKILHRGHGISFHALDQQQPLVITEASQHQVEEICGQGVKLRRFSVEPAHLESWPVVIIPIDSYGVLALDNLDKLSRLTGEAQPEFGLVDFLRRTAQTLGSSIASVRKVSRAQRQQRREEALVRVMAACEDRGKHVSPLYLQHVVLQAIESAFNGVDAYVGLIQPLCSSVLFTSATQRSGMTNQQVNTWDSVSFRVFLSQRPLVIPQVERKQFDVGESQTAQLIQQLRWFTPSQDQGRKGPFVCIPIPFVGILSVDTFPGSAGGVYSQNVPEHGVVECLTKMANLLGQSIRQMTATETKRDIPKLFEGNKSTLHTVFSRLLELIAANVLTAVELGVVCYDPHTWEPIHGAEAPLVALRSEVAEHRKGDTTMTALASQISDCLRVSGTEDERCLCLSGHPEVIILRCADTRDVDSPRSASNSVDWLQSCRSLATAIVVRRVQGATWSYDQEFLLDILPVIDQVLTLVNLRVCGIVSRRNGMDMLKTMCTELENAQSSMTAFMDIPRFVHDTLNVIARASSEIPGDVYMGQRVIGGECLEFIEASDASLMRGVQIELLATENQDLITVGCLQRQRHLIVHLMNAKNAQLLRPLTAKKVQRVFAAFPMSEERVLCIDSLSTEAFDVVNSRFERDVESFLISCASLLEETISTVRYRYAYDQLCDLKSRRHMNLRGYFATLHSVLRREINELHSQQIMRLDEDFTGQFSVLSWHRSATRRPIRGAMPSHFCFINGCAKDLIAQDIHFDQRTALPMTNVPRTLDQSRATMEPAIGREKQGAYACDCLAVMVDVGFVASARLAMCVYSYDSAIEGSKTCSHSSIGRPTAFTNRQRQFFFALGAVASDVYTSVFRSCVLDTYDVESLFVARERLNAKDAVVLEVTQSSDTSSKCVRVVTGCTVAASKWIPGSTLTGKLVEKTLTFHGECLASKSVDFSVTVSKAATAAKTRNTAPSGEHRTAGTASASLPDSKTTDAQGKQSFFRRPRLFGSKEKKAAQLPVTAQSTPISTTPLPPPPPPTAEFHVLFRGYHDNAILSLTVEREISELEVSRQMIVAEVRRVVDEISTRRSHFLANTRGDEEWNGARFGHVPEIGEGEGFGGGGFHVLSCWTHWRDSLRDEIVFFETDMRAYLTGVQATSREQLGVLVASNVRPGLLPSGAPHVPHVPIFSHENPLIRAGAIILVRAALVMCGYKKEVAIDSLPEKDDDLLKEYLRASVGRKLLDLNPRTTAKWAVVLRASNYLKAKFGSLATMEDNSDADAMRGARTLLAFVASFTSAVKYFKFLQDSAKQRKQAVDSTATRIQCRYRVVLAKKTLQRKRLEFRAAVSIQCAFRQHLARRKRAFLKWDRAARTVQRAYRRKLAQRRGRRPRRLTVELRTVAAQYGTMQASRVKNDLGGLDEGDDAWKVEMASFDSVKAYLESRAGREQLKREERVIAERLKEVARHREQTMSPHDRLLADAYDIFELLDIDGSGELSRDRTQELMTRLHIPLSGDEAADVIDMMDNDRSGAISFVEFSNWFTHEFDLLKKRSRECGVLSRRDRQWIADESARSALRKRWRAHQTGAPSPASRPPAATKDVTEAVTVTDQKQEATGEDRDQPNES